MFQKFKIKFNIFIGFIFTNIINSSKVQYKDF